VTSTGRTDTSRAAVITGATGGIGRAIARRVGRLGYRTVLQGRDREVLDGVAAEVIAAGGPEPVTVVCDLVAGSPLELADAVDDLGGRLDLLVSAAGASLSAAPLEELTSEDWETSLRLHLVAPMVLQRLCFPALVAAHGVVVNLGSVVAGAAPRRGAPYAAAKAALAAATRSTAVEWAHHGIRALVVEPGFVDTGFNAELVATGGHERLLRRVPTRSPLDPDEVAQLVLALADPGLAGVTGGTYTIDGGLTARL